MAGLTSVARQVTANRVGRRPSRVAPVWRDQHRFTGRGRDPVKHHITRGTPDQFGGSGHVLCQRHGRQGSACVLTGHGGTLDDHQRMQLEPLDTAVQHAGMGFHHHGRRLFGQAQYQVGADGNAVTPGPRYCIGVGRKTVAPEIAFT